MIRPVLALLSLFTILLGFVYPAVIVGIAQAAFPDEANGSIVAREGRAVGSELVGQPFSDPRYFWPRPSATSPAYDGVASSGSNWGPTAPDLVEAVKANVARLREAHPTQTGPVPVDLVTTSGSGLDPHVSPAAALFQVDRVAAARALPAEEIRDLVVAHVEAPAFGLLGAPRVNVLRLNLALDERAGR